MTFKISVVALTLTTILCGSAAAGTAPMPVGTHDVIVSYETTSGPVSFSGARDYSGVGPTDATNLGAAPNIRAFGSVNSFGRRTVVDLFDPAALGDDEALLAHAFFKIAIADDYFPDILPGSDVTITFEGITFDQPVGVNGNTLMLHMLWNADQADQLPEPYINLHGHNMQSTSFRDFDSFVTAGVFADFPTPNYAGGTITASIVFSNQQTYDISLTFPYAMIEHFEETGQSVPGGLPAPQGYLEPFHFHLEYVVAAAGDVPTVSEIGLAGMCLLLVLAGGLVIARRRQPNT